LVNFSTHVPPSLVALLVSGGLLVGAGGALRAQQPGLDAPAPVGAYMNGVFPTTAPGSSTGWSTENAFPNLTFIDPLWLTEIPASSDLLLVGKNGQLWRFPNQSSVTQAQVVQVLDWSAQTQTSEDQGFYSLVFHPSFGPATSGGTPHVYVCYNHKPALSGADANHGFWRVSRFTWNFASGVIDATSEYVLMNQYDPCRWHNGGAMFFDTDGFLNITCGDGGDSSQGGGLAGALGRTQRLDGGLFSGVFRIDVDNDPSRSHPIRRQPQSPAGKPAGWPESFTQGYMIPNDNPWQDPGGSILEEYHVLGLRSPHTAHYDEVTGEIWIGDVGEGAREEMSGAVKGDNLQWGYREGDIGGPGATPSPLIGNDKAPRLAYDRTVGTCIIGGMRYRGDKWSTDLGGKVLYGDHVRGRIWAATVDGQGAPLIEEIVSGLPVGNKAGLGNFCTDASGEIFLLMVNGTNQPGGTIHKLVTQGVSAEPPALLSETGVFTNLATLETAPGVIPYDVANPLWSDAAAKQRWVILPNDGQHNSSAEDIIFSAGGNWVFPAGTVFVKHFEVALSEADPTLVKRLETRFLVCTDGGGKYGVTYKWNESGTDAELLTIGMSEIYQLALDGGGVETRNWDYPSRADCLLCHNAAAGQALGFRTAQLNRPFHYSTTGRTANQLATFNSLGMFQTTLSPQQLASYIEARPLDDATAPIEHRVRSYLDSNCSHCHQPGALVESFDARLTTPLHEQGLVNGLIAGLFEFDPDGRYVKPGNSALSALHARLDAVGNGDAMPPLAKNVVDDAAVSALAEWINGLVPSQFDTTPPPQARYMRLRALSEVNGNPWTSVAEFRVLDGTGTPIPAGETSIFNFDSQELADEYSPATYAIDGNTGTFWHTEWGSFSPPPPHHITVDLGSVREIGGYVYVPRQGAQNGRIANYQIHRSLNGTDWTLVDSGTWTNDTATRRFDSLAGARPARCQIAGPGEDVGGAFEVTVVFDMNVSDFIASDLQVNGGTVSSLRGSGYYYVATIIPTAGTIDVSVPADAVDPIGEGSLASEVLSIGFIDTLPPVPLFTGVPAQVSGPFEIGLEFGEEVTGLESSDFVVSNGTLNAIVVDGLGFRLAITPQSEGPVSITLLAGAVTDTAGNGMGAGTSVSVLHLQQVLARNAADYNYLGGGMQLVTDPAAPHGQFLWLPDGAYPGNFNLPVKTQHRAEYEFIVPRSGNYRLRGLIRSTDFSSDSFFVEFDGNQALGTVYTWDTQPVGAAEYQWDYLNTRNGADPVVVALTAGTRRVTVYARDDGTRLDRLELESVRPLVVLNGPAGPVSGPFFVSVAFSETVTGLAATDFQLSGGTLDNLTGAGGSYQVRVTPSASSILLSLPENQVTDAESAGNFASNPYSVSVLTAYGLWAHGYGINVHPDGMNDDPDGDGFVNLLEYALGLDPGSGDGAIASIKPAGTELEYTYVRSISAREDGTLYQVEWSDTLAPGGWSADSVSEEITATHGDTETVTAILPAGTSGKRFVRLRVDASPVEDP
jgi:hypothetical protein